MGVRLSELPKSGADSTCVGRSVIVSGSEPHAETRVPPIFALGDLQLGRAEYNRHFITDRPVGSSEYGAVSSEFLAEALLHQRSGLAWPEVVGRRAF